MKELNTVEIANVSGAGYIADTISTVGSVFGTAVQFLGLGKAGANVSTLSKEVGLNVESAILSINAFFTNLFGK